MVACVVALQISSSVVEEVHALFIKLCAPLDTEQKQLQKMKLFWCSVANSNRDNKALMKVKLKDMFLTTA